MQAKMQIALAFLAMVGAAHAGVALPAIPSQYYVEATLTMPYYNLVEPITSWYCNKGGEATIYYY